ncbi:hypothetical protein [Rhodoferax sp.]|uniref:hypothetical protein n=1 Tax=Rhodoferax sp. TaxID=50421 RepID=UPI0027677EF3|nr:hypothetical protein [Rhodoferax sp.]
MQTLRIHHAQAHNRQLLITLPENFPENGLEVIVMSEDIAFTSPVLAAPQPSDLDALFSFLATVQPSGRSAAEIDQQILEERASWDR